MSMGGMVKDRKGDKGNDKYRYMQSGVKLSVQGKITSMDDNTERRPSAKFIMSM